MHVRDRLRHLQRVAPREHDLRPRRSARPTTPDRRRDARLERCPLVAAGGHVAPNDCVGAGNGIVPRAPRTPRGAGGSSMTYLIIIDPKTAIAARVPAHTVASELVGAPAARALAASAARRGQLAAMSGQTLAGDDPDTSMGSSTDISRRSHAAKISSVRTTRHAAADSCRSCRPPGRKLRRSPRIAAPTAGPTSAVPAGSEPTSPGAASERPR